MVFPLIVCTPWVKHWQSAPSEMCLSDPADGLRRSDGRAGMDRLLTMPGRLTETAFNQARKPIQVQPNNDDCMGGHLYAQ